MPEILVLNPHKMHHVTELLYIIGIYTQLLDKQLTTTFQNILLDTVLYASKESKTAVFIFTKTSFSKYHIKYSQQIHSGHIQKTPVV